MIMVNWGVVEIESDRPVEELHSIALSPGNRPHTTVPSWRKRSGYARLARTLLV